MEKIFNERTQSTPLIFFDEVNKILTIEGVSLPEIASELYCSVVDFVESYNFNTLIINHDLWYANSSSSKIIYEIFVKSIKKIENVTIRWFYDDDDLDVFETGKDIEEMLNHKMEFYPKKRPRRLFYEI